MPPISTSVSGERPLPPAPAERNQPLEEELERAAVQTVEASSRLTPEETESVKGEGKQGVESVTGCPGCEDMDGDNLILRSHVEGCTRVETLRQRSADLGPSTTSHSKAIAPSQSRLRLWHRRLLICWSSCLSHQRRADCLRYSQ